MKSTVIYSLLVGASQLSTLTVASPINGEKDARDAQPGVFNLGGKPPTVIHNDVDKRHLEVRVPKGGRGGGRGGGGGGGGIKPTKNNPPPPPATSAAPPPPPATSKAPPPPPSSSAPPPPPPSSKSVPAPSSSSAAPVPSSSSVQTVAQPTSSVVSSNVLSISRIASSTVSGSMASSVLASSAATSSVPSSESVTASDIASSIAASMSGSSLSPASSSGSVTGSTSLPISTSSSITNTGSTSGSTSVTSSASLSTITGTSSSIAACQLTRGNNGKMSIDKRNNGCDPTQSTVTEWQSKAEVIKGNPKSFVCKGKEWPQACYHYYSVIENNPKFASLTCHDNADRHDGIATDDWKKQHTLSVFTKSYFPKELINVDVRKGGKSMTTVLCDRDEYPPAYFMPNKPKEQITGQIVRWLPGSENKGAGSIWKEFCEKFDGGEGNGRFHKQDGAGGIKKGDLNMNNVETSVGAIKKKKGTDGSTTTITTLHATYTRAVFSMKFDNNWPLKPNKANNWGLEENPCWPKAVVPEDPGFVLLTDDNWYKTADGAWADIDKARANVKAELYAKKPKKNDKAAQAAMQARIAAADKIKATWKRGLPSLDLEILDDGLGIRNANTSERLDAREYEVIQCETADCENERRGLHADEIAAILPGRSAELVEPVPADAMATSMPQTLVKAFRAETGSGVRADLPRVTAV